MTRPQRRYVALLRGINVGGSAVVKMTAVRKVFESIGLSDVETYIQSGNAVFSAAITDTERLGRRIEQEFAAATGHRITVFVLTPAELKKAAARNPFDPERHEKTHRCHLMFLSARPEAERCRALIAQEGREYRFRVRDKVLYYTYPRTYEGKRRSIDVERILGVKGTSRTWKVVDKLIELSQ